MSWLQRNVAAVKRIDPAERTTLEVLLTYPVSHALFWLRLSHLLYRQ
ncbi:serine O-acetyltransferase, partial [Enterococcus faecalis]|nr:serine O-acetyltransferase [Enterococcus faecalis]